MTLGDPSGILRTFPVIIVGIVMGYGMPERDIPWDDARM